MMVGFSCNACNKEFVDDAEQKLHYKSEWHRYNLKRKVAGIPGVTEALFQAKLSAMLEQKNKLGSADPLTYACTICGKEYRSAKAHAQHLNSKGHIMKASVGSSLSNEVMTVIKPTPNRQASKPPPRSKIQVSNKSEDEESEESEGEWKEVDPNDVDEVSESLTDKHVDESNSQDDENIEMDDIEELDPSSCFICDQVHKDIEACIVHLHKQHGFFIPDIEYLKDPKGFLIYVGLKVKRDFTCLYCDDRRHPFQTLEAVRKHMIAKGHCKVHYGDGGDEEEVELEEFYDYSSSYVDPDGKQILLSDDLNSNVELGTDGAELIITKRSEEGVSVRTLGSREYLRYYKQKPRPSQERNIALAISLASRYRSMGIVTVQSRHNLMRMKVLRSMNRSGVEAMRSKMGMKSNVIRNLPNNVPY